MVWLPSRSTDVSADLTVVARERHDASRPETSALEVGPIRPNAYELGLIRPVEVHRPIGPPSEDDRVPSGDHVRHRPRCSLGRASRRPLPSALHDEDRLRSPRPCPALESSMTVVRRRPAVPSGDHEGCASQTSDDEVCVDSRIVTAPLARSRMASALEVSVARRNAMRLPSANTRDQRPCIRPGSRCSPSRPALDRRRRCRPPRPALCGSVALKMTRCRQARCQG